MMNGSKRNLFEKIVLLILFLIVLPFIILFGLVFVLVYIIIYPFEATFYKRSSYYKDLNEKYYTFITLTNRYNTYNKLKKDSNNLLYKADVNYLLVNKELIDNNENIKETFNIKTEKKITLVINKKQIDSNIYQEIKQLNYIIIYED